MSLIRFVVILMLCVVATAEARPFKNTDVFELESARDPQISPDGSRIAYARATNDIMTDRTRQNIWLVASDGSDHRPLLSGKANYSSPRWSPTGDRLAYVSAIEGGKPQLFVRWMDTGQTALLSNLQETPQSLAWSPDGNQIAFSMFVEEKSEPLASPPAKPDGAEWAKPVTVIDSVTYRNDGSGYRRNGFNHIFTLPADGGTPRQITDGEYNHGGGLSWTPDSNAIVFSGNRNDDWALDPAESNIWRVNVANKEFTKLTDRDGPDGAPVVSPDGAHIAYLGYDDELLGYHNTRLSVMNADGTEKRVLTGELDRSVDAVQWAGDETLIIQYTDRGRTYLARVGLDATLSPLVRDLGGVVFGRPYTSGQFSVSNNGDFAYTSARAQRPSDIAVKRGDAPATRLTRLNEDLFTDVDLQPVTRITWRSSVDQREIEGWFITPPNFDPAQQYPMILEIHGGPFASYGPIFSAEAQLFAAAGYVVFYTNPRGSTSYGAEFANLIHHAYPGNDYDDLISGVDALVGRGFVDPEQLYVTGGSGGGVLTAWIVGKTDKFRAAAVAKPVINWTSFSSTADGYPFFYKYWFGATPWDAPEKYWERSPLSLVGNVSTPTMLITGESDYRTPISETEQYYQALKLRGIDTLMVRVPDAPHLIAGRPSNLIAKVDNIVAWFERYRATND